MNRTMIAGLSAALLIAACGKKEAAPQQAMPGMEIGRAHV